MKLTYEVLSVSDVKDAVDCIAKTFVDKENSVNRDQVCEAAD